VCERTFRRYIDRYEEAGLEGLIDKRLEQVSQRRAPVDEVLAVTERYRRRHLGWNVKHFYALSRSSTSYTPWEGRARYCLRFWKAFILPRSVFGPVLNPPCNRHRPFAMALHRGEGGIVQRLVRSARSSRLPLLAGSRWYASTEHTSPGSTGFHIPGQGD
jgi:hypothetical protein